MLTGIKANDKREECQIGETIKHKRAFNKKRTNSNDKKCADDKNMISYIYKAKQCMTKQHFIFFTKNFSTHFCLSLYQLL